MKLRVWGKINGMPFDQVFNDVTEWKSERQWIENLMRIVVHGIQSVDEHNIDMC